MEWLLPAGAWAFGCILVVIVLYILRRKATRHEVPSLLLWQKTESAQEASRPFQKLRKQWLLFLQLLLVTMMAFALLRPALPGGPQGELVLVMDVSASMQAALQGKSRLELSVEDAMALVDGMKEGDAVTVLTAGSTVGQVLARSTDQQKIKAALRALKAENGGADMEAALSLAFAMRRDLPELGIVVYSDAYADTGASNQGGVEIRSLGGGADNRSLLSLRCSPQETGLAAFARVANYGAAAEVTLECFADGVLCDLRTISLVAGGEESVQFSVPGNAAAVWVTITTPDALALDNTRYWVAKEKRERRVLLVTQGNVFLEKALALRQDAQVLKTTALDLNQADVYDLVILDGQPMAELPATGSLLVFSPTAAVLGLSAGATQETAGALRAGRSDLAQQMTKNLLLSDFSLRSYRPISGGQSVLTWGGATLAAAAEENGRRAVAVGFDLHDSNLPMKPDFPILMQNLLDYLLPETVSAVEDASAGPPVHLVPDEQAVSAQVLTPSGRSVPVGGTVFSDTGEIGIYALQEERADGTRRVTPFVLHMDPAEADVRQVAASVLGQGGAEAQRRGAGQELTPYFLLLALAVLLLEWGVSRRGA